MKKIALLSEHNHEKAFISSLKSNVFSDYLKRMSKFNINVLLNSANFQSSYYMAKYIHINSNRNNKLFKQLNCNKVSDDLIDIELFGCEPGIYRNFPEGKNGIFENYNGGTVYLEEVSKLPLFVQYKLLDLIEEGTLLKSGSIKKIMVDVNLIVSTKNEIKELMRKGLFLKGLYYSLIEIKVPN